MFISAVLIIIFMGVLPLIIGTIICCDDGMIVSYYVGFVSMMAICELIAVPCSIFKCSFITVVIVFFVVIVALLLFGRRKTQSALNTCSTTKLSIKSYSIVEYICLSIMILLLGVVIINSVRLHVIDEDDSRFVVTAADILRTNELFLTDPNTGVVHDCWSYGEDVSKDIIAPHAVFCAIFSKVTLTNATVFMHTIYPIVLYILAVCIYYNLISELIEGNERLKNDRNKESYKFLFIAFILLFTIFQYSTKSTRETMFLVRIWQGKAVLASVIIPSLLWILYRVYRKPNKLNYCLLFITSLAGCLTSSMATLLIPMLLGIYGLVYGISKKSIKLSCGIWISTIIPVLLAFLSLYIKSEML